MVLVNRVKHKLELLAVIVTNSSEHAPVNVEGGEGGEINQVQANLSVVKQLL